MGISVSLEVTLAHLLTVKMQANFIEYSPAERVHHVVCKIGDLSTKE
jgi:hypothetical protein